MAYGAKILNSSGYIQIDESYSNYTLIQSGSVYSPATWGATNRTPGTVSFPAQSNPVVVCIGTTGSAYVAVVSVTQSSFSIISDIAVTVSYRVYALISDTSMASGYGFMVRNASGKNVFHSNANYLRMHQLNFLQQTAAAATPSFGHSFGAAYVAVTGTWDTLGLYTANPFTAAYFVVSAFRNASNAVYFSGIYGRKGPPAPVVGMQAFGTVHLQVAVTS